MIPHEANEPLLAVPAAPKSEIIQELFEAHFRSTQAWAKKKKYEKRKKGGDKGKGRARGDDSDSDTDSDSDADAGEASSADDTADSAAEDSHEEGTEAVTNDAEAITKALTAKQRANASEKKVRPGQTAGIRKVRLGTFEDTGKCKG